MKLHSPRFEKSLKRSVKQAIRTSKSWKAQYRRAKKGVRTIVPNVYLRPLWSLFIGLIVLSATRATGHMLTGLTMITIYLVPLVCGHVVTLYGSLYRAPDLRVLFLLPVSNETIFRWELEKFLKRTAILSLVDIFCAYSALGLYADFSAIRWAGLCLLAVFTWMTSLTTVLLCAARWPKGPYPIVWAMSYLCGFALLWGWKLFGVQLLHLVDSLAPVLNLFSPTGWCPSLFQLFLPSHDPYAAVLIIPPVIILWTARSSLTLLRSKVTFHEFTQLETPDIIPSNDDRLEDDEVGLRHEPEAAVATGFRQEPQKHAGITEIQDIIQSRQFLAPAVWRADFFEKMLWKWFSARERAVVDFMFVQRQTIVRSWLMLLRIFAVVVVLVFLVRPLSFVSAMWIFGIGICITALHALALMWNGGSAFRLMASSGVNIPMYAAYPVTLRELSSILFKITVAQLPMLMAYVIASAGLISYFTFLPLWLAVVAGIKIAVLICAGAFIIMSLRFSGGTNDSTGFRVRTITLIALFLSGTLVFLGLSGSSLFVPYSLMGWFLLAVAVAEAYGVFRIYAWFHATNKFDLMKMPRQ